MRIAKTVVLLILAAGLLVSVPAVQADDSVYNGEGANIFPVESRDISLDYELLIITQNEIGPLWDFKSQVTNDVRVDVLFVLKNRGKAQTVTVGFPEAFGYEPGMEEGETAPTIRDFRVELDGVPVETVVQPLAKRNEEFQFDRVHLWRMHFAVGQTRTVRNTYRFEPSYSSNGEWNVRYILKTGRLWAGPIGRIDVVVRAPIPVRGFRFIPYPEEYSEFHAINWEPDRDMEYISNSRIDEVLFSKCRTTEDAVALENIREIYDNEAARRRAEIRLSINGLSHERLSLCTRDEIQTYINGLYATYGRTFQTAAWAGFFRGKWWYQADPRYSDNLLSAEDQKTLARLKEYLEKALTPRP